MTVISFSIAACYLQQYEAFDCAGGAVQDGRDREKIIRIIFLCTTKHAKTVNQVKKQFSNNLVHL